MAAQKAAEKNSRQIKAQQAMLCDNLSFAAAEAYKLLRTNLMFSLPDKPCRIIGVTSSTRGEGKSTTSVNLAYSFAEAGKKVLLIDADMRLPSVSAKLSIPSAPGLSNLLAGLSKEKESIQQSKYFTNWYILPAGDIPPNPSELLGSERMHALLKWLSGIFEFIIIDLPPVNIVADALVISQWTDGLIAAVRQNYSDRRSLNSCMYQINKLQAKFLGFVMTDASVSKTGSKRYGKYKYGYDKSEYGYGDSAVDGKDKKAFLDAAKAPRRAETSRRAATPKPAENAGPREPAPAETEDTAPVPETAETGTGQAENP